MKLRLVQKIINVIYRFPKARLKLYRRFGGYFNYRILNTGNKQMTKALSRLPPSISYIDGLTVYFLTGERFLHQTIFCIRSLTKVSSQKYCFILVDDGTFTDKQHSLVSAKVPGAIVVSAREIEMNLDKHLPVSNYPYLRQKRQVYPHLKKLTDIHTISRPGHKLVLDSDMLFWKEPGALINWLKNPTQPIYMLDCELSYGYSQSLMEKLTGCKIQQLINVGAIGFDSKDIKWDNLERWVSAMEAEEGTSYYLEQALTAMSIGDLESRVLNRDEYIVNPQNLDKIGSVDILHHYVDVSKRIYLEKAWKLI